ncbi:MULTISPECIES: phosphatase PAP2 family protein [unclassified Streptomyces]|uniref:phosphatase PAP2 family protein n=1 Tax=unclassified Streptomyces TaxID=2593676 RepID=UPI00278C1266|nr:MULTISPECIES: phosphatase PAP2 family protein [unclassified Streptomyces]
MRETPRSQETAGETGSGPPQLRPGRALAHTPGASGSGTPHRSDGRPPQTPRGARHAGQFGRLGATPPALRRPAIFLAAALLFALLTWQVAAEGALLAYDERLGDAIRTSAIPSGPAEFFADLGNMAVALPVLALTLAYVTWRTRERFAPVVAVVTMALVPALVAPLQSLVARPGPPPMAPATGFYPSGHAATAAVAYGLCVLLSPRSRTPRARELAYGCVLLNAAVGLGLVRQGYHWPVDVVGSWCLSVVLLCAAAYVIGRGAVSRSRRRSSSGTASC